MTVIIEPLWWWSMCAVAAVFLREWYHPPVGCDLANVQTNSSCSGPCAAGRFGATPGQPQAQCTGVCSAGYYCPAGSTNATSAACPPGTYSDTGAAACTLCPAGRYGAALAAASSACDGPCAAGRYGDAPGATNDSCAGECPAGYACGSGTVNATSTPCPPGLYSMAGSDVCAECPVGTYGATWRLGNASCSGPCPAGRYGGVSGLPSALCSGVCTAGYACPPASTSSTAEVCAVGKYSLVGAAMCLDCAAGLYGSVQGLSTASCSGPCAPGRYGDVGGQALSNCVGSCTAGWVCPAGSTNSSVTACGVGRYSLTGASSCIDCPAGQFGAGTALSTAICSGACTPGSYCPAGSVTPVRMAVQRVCVVSLQMC